MPRVPLKFADKCSIHCRGAERIEVDQLRLVWLRRKLRCRFFNVRERASLEARVARIERRRLRWVWKTDPTVPGATIALQPHDLARAEGWLRDVAGVEPDGLTARAYDQCLWAAALCLSRRYDEGMALPESEEGAAGRGAMADEDLPGGVKPYARPFSLVPPPRDRQFRTAQLKVERTQRKAERRLEAALDDGEAAPRRQYSRAQPRSGLPSGIASCGETCRLRTSRKASPAVGRRPGRRRRRGVQSGMRPSTPFARPAAPPRFRSALRRANGGSPIRTSTVGERQLVRPRCAPVLGADPEISTKSWSGRRDSNPRPQPWQGCALPLSYTRIQRAASPPFAALIAEGRRDCNTLVLRRTTRICQTALRRDTRA